MLLSSRKAVLSKCVDLENEVRGLFKIFGIKLPPKLGHGAFDVTVRDIIEVDEALSHALLPLLDARLVLYQTFRVLDNRTRQNGACRSGLRSTHERAGCWLYHRTHLQSRCR